MLRKLSFKDIPFMLEWMHNEKINCNFRYPFATMNEIKVKAFIENSFTKENQHFAFTDAEGIYLGTISLKNISAQDKNAEYAIVTRECAQGTGAAFKATQEILRYAFENLNLQKVYLNVLAQNVRANKFYQKCGFQFEGAFKQHLFLHGDFYDLNWYAYYRNPV